MAPRSYATTSHTGTYPAGFDLGLLAHIGIRASKYTADRRNHGKLLLSQERVDDLGLKFADRLWQNIGNDLMDKMPVEARGVVHMVVPMLHAHLDDLVGAMELARVVLDVEDRSTCDSLQCIAFTPFSDRRTAWCGAEDETSYVRFRNRTEAVHHEHKAFTLDATVDDASIIDEAVFSRQAVTCAADNLFETPDVFFSSFRNVSTLLGELAADAARGMRPIAADGEVPATVDAAEAVAVLHQICCYFHGVEGAELPPNCDTLYAADAAVLLDLLYPAETRIKADTITAAWAAAPALVYKKVLNCENGARIDELGLPPAQVAEAKARWARFCRRDKNVCTWHAALAPLLVELIERNGTFDNSLEDIARMRDLMSRAMKFGAFYVHSADGRVAPVAPSALAGVRAPHQVRVEHLRPVFAGRVIGIGGRRVEARGPVAGTVPMGTQLVLHLLLAARVEHKGGVLAQYERNEGGVCVRPSSAAYIRTQAGKKRSEKATSPTSVEGDAPAMGDQQEKEKLAYMNLAAFDRNVQLAEPILLNVCAPADAEVRRRGELQDAEYSMRARRAYTAEGRSFREKREDDAIFAAAR